MSYKHMKSNISEEEIKQVLVDHLGFGDSHSISWLYENGVLDRFKIKVKDSDMFYRGICVSKLKDINTNKYGVFSRRQGVAESFALAMEEEPDIYGVLLTVKPNDTVAIFDMVACYNYYSIQDDFAQDLISYEDEHFIVFNNYTYNVLCGPDS